MNDAQFAQLVAMIQALHVRLDEEHVWIAGKFAAMQRQMDERFAAVDARFDRERSLVAGQFEAMQKYMDTRFNLLAEALEIQFGALDRRVRRLENNR